MKPCAVLSRQIGGPPPEIGQAEDGVEDDRGAIPQVEFGQAEHDLIARDGGTSGAHLESLVDAVLGQHGPTRLARQAVAQRALAHAGRPTEQDEAERRAGPHPPPHG